MLTVKDEDTDRGGQVTVEMTEVTVTYRGKSMCVIESDAIEEGSRILTDAAAYLELVGTTVAVTE